MQVTANIICFFTPDQSTSGADGGQYNNVALQKVEATAENNAASNHSSGYMACLDRDKELIEKGSDAQVSYHL